VQEAGVLAQVRAPVDGDLRPALAGTQHFDAAPAVEGSRGVDAADESEGIGLRWHVGLL
jgi:hypothetical protein